MEDFGEQVRAMATALREQGVSTPFILRVGRSYWRSMPPVQKDSCVQAARELGMAVEIVP